MSSVESHYIKNPVTGRFNLFCHRCGQKMCGQDVASYNELKVIRDSVGWVQSPNPVCGTCLKLVVEWRDGTAAKPRIVLKKRRARR
jgi:hypothetical protein